MRFQQIKQKWGVSFMYYIVANPNSERGRTMFYLPGLTSLFDKAEIPYETHITTGPMDGYEKTFEFCKGRQDLKGVIGLGGDGIIQEVVAGMAAAFSFESGKIPVPLGILPSATGNDFVGTLEGSKHLAKIKYSKSNEDVCQNLFEAISLRRMRTVDIMTAGGMAFLNIGHVGLDAEITKNAAELKQKFDNKSYLASSYKTIARYKSMQLAIKTSSELENKIYEGAYTMVAIANGQYYGSGIRICPEAKIDDGKITMCQIRAMSRLKTMLIIPMFLMEKHMRLKSVSFTECDSVKISFPSGFEYICLDGNIYPCEKEIEFKILPQALSLFV